MAKFTVKNVEFDFDIFDADNAELYEIETEKVRKESLKTVKSEKLSQKIRRIGNVVCQAIDTIFGEGKSHELFGDKVNLTDIALTFKQIDFELTKATNAEQTEMLNNVNKSND